MFKRYVSYLFGNLAMAAFIVSLSLASIIWLTQSLRFVDLIVNRGLSVGTFLYLSTLLLPAVFGVILPIAVFCSALFSYNRLIMDSELVVLRSAGLSRMQLAMPPLLLAGIVTLIGYVISLYLLPVSYREFKDLQSFIRDHYGSVLLQEEVFNTPMKGLTVFIRDRESNGTLRGIFVHDNRDPAHSATMMAEEGQLISTPNGPQFLLVNGNRQEVHLDAGRLAILHFESYTLDMSFYSEEETRRWRSPKERFLDELFEPGNEPESLKQKMLAEAHQRLTWPAYAFSLTLIAMVALLTGDFNRRGLWRRISMATLLGVLLLGAAVGAKSLTSANPNFAVLMYALVILSSLIPLMILSRYSWGSESPGHRRRGGA